MRINKYFWLAVVFTLLGFNAEAMAQSVGDVGDPSAGAERIVGVEAVETSEGQAGFDYRTQRDSAFTRTFFGRTTGEFPGSLTFAITVTPSAQRGVTSDINGGTWTLPVYMTEVRGGFAGSLFGTVTKGAIFWDETHTTAQTTMEFAVEGGTLAWQGATGTAFFHGTIVEDAQNQTRTLRGKLEFVLN